MVQNKKLKEIIILILKIALSVGLILWLVMGGKLDFGQLSVLFENPWLLLFNISIWLVAAILLGSLRWLLLLRGLGYELTYKNALALHFIGLFFNTAMPGAVGGDLVKVTYVIRGNRHLTKTSAMMSVLLDRVLGLFGLFTIGTIMITANYEGIMANNIMKPMASIVILATLAAFLVFSSVFIRTEEDGDIISRILKRFSLLSPIRGLYLSFRSYQHKKSYLIGSFLISIVIQLLMFTYFCVLTRYVSTPDAPIVDLAVIFPIGVAATALPLAPAGVGVGHMAFDSLFTSVGLSGGANVFNVYVISSLALGLLGAIPYVAMRRTYLNPTPVASSSPALK